MPVRLGREGVEEIVEFELDDRERDELHESAGSVRELVDTMATL